MINLIDRYSFFVLTKNKNLIILILKIFGLNHDKERNWKLLEVDPDIYHRRLIFKGTRVPGF
jgi:hypothetical protein